MTAGSSAPKRVPGARLDPATEAEGRPGKATPSGGTRRAGAEEDRALVAQAQGGSREAFEELVRRHQHRSLAVAGGILRRREDAEDVVQQVFVKVFLSLRSFDQRAAFSTWLYKITVNECWDYLRKKRVRPLLYEADLSEEQARRYVSTRETGSAAGLDAGVRMVTRERVDGLLEALDPVDRSMLILKEVEGFSVGEIARMMELNGNTVKVRLFRARRRMVELHRKRARKESRQD